MRLHFAGIAALAATTFTGCFNLGGSTDGEKGRATFTYLTGQGCFFGCDVSTPLMVGTAETISIEAKHDALPSGLQFESSNPAVLAVGAATNDACCRLESGSSCGPDLTQSSCPGSFTEIYTLVVFPQAPGHAELVARAADGSMFDSVQLEAAAPRSVTFSCASNPNADPMTSLTLETACDFQVVARDADGRVLQASQGFEISSSNPKIVRLRPLLFLGSLDNANNAPVTVSDGQIVPVASGKAMIAITADAISTSIPVSVP